MKLAMKPVRPFNLREAKMGLPVQLRDGAPARIICFDKKGGDNIVALVTEGGGGGGGGGGGESVAYFDNEGYHYKAIGPYNLVMAECPDPKRHVDDFVDFGTKLSNTEDKGEIKARWFLMLKRMPAILQAAFMDKLKEAGPLFCEYEGKEYRVTGGSRMGDVWLTADVEQETGYDLRVDVSKCSNWR